MPIVVLLLLFLSGCYFDEGEEFITPDVVSFATDIQPIFSNNCTSCHPVLIASPDLTEGNSYDAITNGLYIVPNDPEASLLYQRLLGNPRIMPPSGSLPISQIQLIENWIDQGAPDN
ncbi:MAG: hypothetical protein OER83_02545 [Flavobacteriaceae bacterium]|nr:hypothetical protein [Flavobacteriaceae bacterium]